MSPVNRDGSESQARPAGKTLGIQFVRRYLKALNKTLTLALANLNKKSWHHQKSMLHVKKPFTLRIQGVCVRTAMEMESRPGEAWRAGKKLFITMP